MHVYPFFLNVFYLVYTLFNSLLFYIATYVRKCFTSVLGELLFFLHFKGCIIVNCMDSITIYSTSLTLKAV
jgi:hypothetical protein